MTAQTRAMKKERKEHAAAEAFIDQEVQKVKKRRSKKDPWPCTAEDLTRERDSKGLSWAQVAANLGLGSPGQARKAYSELTGRSHKESQPIVKRSKTSRVPGSRKREAILNPQWNDDSDQDEIEHKLRGEWVESKGSGKDFVPAHWSGSRIRVIRKPFGIEMDEDFHVSRVVKFTYGPDGDQPLQVAVIEADSQATRIFRVKDIVEVQ